MSQLQLKKNTLVSEKSTEENIIAAEVNGSDKQERSALVMIIVHYRNWNLYL